MQNFSGRKLRAQIPAAWVLSPCGIAYSAPQRVIQDPHPGQLWGEVSLGPQGAGGSPGWRWLLSFRGPKMGRQRQHGGGHDHHHPGTPREPRDWDTGCVAQPREGPKPRSRRVRATAPRISAFLPRGADGHPRSRGAGGRAAHHDPHAPGDVAPSAPPGPAERRAGCRAAPASPSPPRRSPLRPPGRPLAASPQGARAPAPRVRPQRARPAIRAQGAGPGEPLQPGAAEPAGGRGGDASGGGARRGRPPGGGSRNVSRAGEARMGKGERDPRPRPAPTRLCPSRSRL